MGGEQSLKKERMFHSTSTHDKWPFYTLEKGTLDHRETKNQYIYWYYHQNEQLTSEWGKVTHQCAIDPVICQITRKNNYINDEWKQF